MEKIKKNNEKTNLLRKLYIFTILFEKLDSLKPYQLSFKDIELLNHNWISNKDLILNYPSFYFWLCKNYDFFETIKKEIIINSNKNIIPFWIICLRIITSINCITNNEIDKRYQQDIICFIKNEIKNKQSNLNSNWINLVMTNVNEKIKVQIFGILYYFIIEISKDSKIIRNKLNEEKYNIIKDIFKKIYSSVFLNQLSDILKKDINSEEPIIKFIVNPNDYIYQQFTVLLDNLKNKIISHQSFQDLKEMMNNYGKQFNSIVSNIENSINEEISKKNEQKKIELQKKIRENFENENKILVENIDNYIFIEYITHIFNINNIKII